MDDNTSNEGLRGLAEFVAEQAQPKSMILLTGDKAEGHRDLMAVPKGFHLESVKRYLDEYLLTPERIRGISRHTTLQSFLDHFAVFKADGTAIFANGNASDPKVVAVYNYNISGDKPQFGDHRSTLDCTLSDEWKVWTKGAAEQMTQQSFAQFIEDHIGDIQPNLDFSRVSRSGG